MMVAGRHPVRRDRREPLARHGRPGQAGEFYTETDAGPGPLGRPHHFMDIDNSPTVIVTHEADVAATRTTITTLAG